MMRLVGAVFLWTAACVVPRAEACSFCPGAMQRTTLGFELEQAAVVLYGTLANPRLNMQADALPGTGSTDFHIDKVLKNQPHINLAKSLSLPRYVPVLDAKSPPRYLVFFEMHKEKLEFALGRTASPAAVAYLEGAAGQRSKGRVQALGYYAKFLDHADPAIADDAFLEFARSKDNEIGQAAKELSPAFVRRLLQQPRLEPERLSLFAFLLGGCGGDEDARYLRKLAAEGGDSARAVDGVLAGYINLRPKEGWQLTHTLLADPKQSFHIRVGAIRTLRFYHGWQPKETHPQVVHGLSLIIPDGDLADFAIEDLRQWKAWDLTEAILAQFGKASHEAPIIRRAIIRYALCCPLPEARDFINRIRPREAETIREIEEGLVFERQAR